MQIGTGSAHGAVLIFLLLLHFLLPVSIPQPFPPHPPSPLRLSVFAVYLPLSLLLLIIYFSPPLPSFPFFTSLSEEPDVFLVWFIQGQTFWLRACAAGRMLSSRSDARWWFLPSLLMQMSFNIYIYIKLLHHHCGHNLIYLLFCLTVKAAKGREGKMFQNVLLYLCKHQRVHDGNHTSTVKQSAQCLFFMVSKWDHCYLFIYVRCENILLLLMDLWLNISQVMACVRNMSQMYSKRSNLLSLPCTYSMRYTGHPCEVICRISWS